jgi:hypothetical protein
MFLLQSNGHTLRSGLPVKNPLMFYISRLNFIPPGTGLCDVIITFSMMYYLIKARTGLRNTDTIITRIITVTMETGFLTAAFAIVDVSLFLGFPGTNYHIAASLPLAKLYSNSLLAVRFHTSSFSTLGDDFI